MYLAAALLLFASWFVSTFLLPWTGWHKEVLAFAAALLVIAETLRCSWRARSLALPKLTVWFLVLLLVLTWQAASGTRTFRGDAIMIACYLLVAVGVVAAGYAQTDPQTSAAWLAALLLAAGVASCVLALVQTLDVWPEATWIYRADTLRRPGANLGQPNHLATLLLFSLASLAYLYRLRRLSAAMSMVLGTVLLGGLAQTESRTGILGVLLLGAWGWWQRPTRAERRTLVLGLLGYAVLVGFWPLLHQAIQWDGGAAAQFNTTGSGRQNVWPQLWHAVLLKPWWGWGLRQVSEAHNAVLDAYPVGEPYTYAHNIVLDLALGVGLPLTALLAAAALIWVWRRLQGGRDSVNWYALAMVLVLGLHAMFEFPFAYAYLLFPVLFMAGILEARLAPRSILRLPLGFAAAVFVVVAAVLAWSVWEYPQVEEDFRVARFEAVHIGHTPTAYERPRILLLTQLDTMLQASRIVPAPNMSAAQLELARQAAMRFPWVALQNRYALSLALNGSPDEAIRQLKVMRAMYGEKTYTGIKANWVALTQEKYPQLRALSLP